MKKLLILLAVLFTVLPFGFAQVDTGNIQGSVTDPSGALVQGASVEATNAATGFKKVANSGTSGEFTIPSLPAGSYNVVITAPGFAALNMKAVVTVGGSTTLQPKVSMNASTTLEVSAAANEVQINTTNQEISEVITPRQIMSLPSLTRNPYDFVALSGNVSTDPNGSTGPNGVGVSINGLRSASTEILLDGVENVDAFSASVGQQIPLDSVAEFRIITNGFDAQYGRASGGIVNLATKSGTNSFHGSLYEYNRVSALASNTYNEDAINYVNRKNNLPQNPHDHFTRNQFGYSVGGPVLKDKLFFFSNTEWNRIRSAGAQNSVIPTASFIASSAPATQAFFKQYGSLAPGATLGATIPVAGFTGPDPLQTVSYIVPSDAGAGAPVNAYSSLDRVDYTVSEKLNLFLRYGLYHDVFQQGTNASSPYNGYNTGTTDHNQSFLLDVNYTLNPNLVSSSKISYSRLVNEQPLGTAPVGPTLYLNQGNTASVDTATGNQIAMPGYLPFSPGNAIPFGGPQNFYQFGEDLSYLHKAHSFHFGGQFIQLRDNRVFGAYENSVEQVAKGGTKEGAALTQLQSGSIYSFQGAINPQGKSSCATDASGKTIQTPACTLTLPATAPDFERENTFNDGNVYLSDSWKISSRFTVNAGIRWEYYGVQHNTNPNLESNFYFGKGATFFDQIRSGQVLTTPNSPIHALISQKFHNFAPRVGFAMDIFGDGKWALRGGYGISYERNFGNVTFNVIQNPPGYAVISLVSGIDVPKLPVYTDNAGPLAGSGSKAIPKVSLRAVDPNIPVAYSHQYDLSLEHQLAVGTVLKLEYSGSRGIHQYSIANVNQPYSGDLYEGDTHAGNRLNYQYSNINLREANGDSYFNSLNVNFESDRFASSGLQVTANYTLAHALDNLSSTFSQSYNNFNLGYLNPFNPSLDHGNADYDVRHRVVVAGTYQPKFLQFNNSSAFVRTLAGGLQFSPIFVANSGSAFTIYDCTNAFSGCPRIVNAPGLPKHGTPVENGNPNSYNYITLPAAAANPYTNPTYGISDLPTCTSGVCTQNPGMGRNQYHGPGFYNINLNAAKNFKFGERYNLQLRSEFYNLLNHHNFYIVPGSADFSTGNPVLAVKGSPQGQLNAADERRNVQLVVRLEF